MVSQSDGHRKVFGETGTGQDWNKAAMMTSSDHTMVSYVVDDDKGQTGLCCLQGCLSGTVVGVSLFVALPVGIILVVLSGTNHTTIFLALGCVLIVLPVLVLLGVIALCFNKKRLPCNKQKHQSAQTIQVAVVDTGSSDGYR